MMIGDDEAADEGEDVADPVPADTLQLVMPGLQLAGRDGRGFGALRCRLRVLRPVPAPYALYLAIGAGNLRPYVQGQDDRGGAALSN